jgi:hypothetical protein
VVPVPGNAHHRPSKEALSDRRHDAEYAALHTILEDVARNGERVTYEDLARRIDERVGSACLYATNKELWHLLSRLQQEDATEKRPLLSVVVVHKTGDHLPGPGFFELARQLGRMPADMDEATFAERETRAVYERWRRGG